MSLMKLAIVDDNETVRISLRIVFGLFDDIEIVGEGANGVEAIEICQQTRVEVLLLDLSMPIMDGVTAIHILHEILPHIQIVVLTSTIDPNLIREAIQAGAFSCVSKQATLNELYDAVTTAFDPRI